MERMEPNGSFAPPPADFFIHHPEKHWPAWKFGMEMEELYTTLPHRFNITTYPLLDADAFFQDVSSASHSARDKDEFFQMLRERRDLREKELRQLWLRSFRQIAGRPSLIDPGLWPNAMHIYHYNSFDTLVRFFADFVPSEESEEGTAFPPSPRSSSATSADPASPARPGALCSTGPAPTTSPEGEQEIPLGLQKDPGKRAVPRRRLKQAGTGRLVPKSVPGEAGGPRRSTRLRERARHPPASGNGSLRAGRHDATQSGAAVAKPGRRRTRKK